MSMFSEDLREHWHQQAKLAKEKKRMDEKEKAELMKERAQLQAKLEALENEKKRREGAAQTNSPRPLDEDDKLRLENILLKERLIERDKNDARNAFYDRLVKKYGIDSQKHQVFVDANSMTFSLKDK